MGKVLQEIGRTAEAAECYEKVLEVDYTHPEAMLNLGNLNFEAGLYEPAKVWFSKVADLPHASRNTKEMALNNLGNLYRTVDLHDIAEGAFARAWEVSGRGNAASLVNVWVARRSQARWDGWEVRSGEERSNELRYRIYGISTSSISGTSRRMEPY